MEKNTTTTTLQCSCMDSMHSPAESGMISQRHSHVLRAAPVTPQRGRQNYIPHDAPRSSSCHQQHPAQCTHSRAETALPGRSPEPTRSPWHCPPRFPLGIPPAPTPLPVCPGLRSRRSPPPPPPPPVRGSRSIPQPPTLFFCGGILGGRSEHSA